MTAATTVATGAKTAATAAKTAATGADHIGGLPDRVTLSTPGGELTTASTANVFIGSSLLQRNRTIASVTRGAVTFREGIRRDGQ
jgi:hypothetical protein